MPGKIIKSIPLLILLLIMSSAGYSQEIDILLKGGHVIDPANNIDAVMDVAISNGRIAKVAPDISTGAKGAGCKRHVCCSWSYQYYTHFFNWLRFQWILCVSPDDITFKSGITQLWMLASGWRNFQLFKSQVIDRSQMLAFLRNPFGMTGSHPENINEMDRE